MFNTTANPANTSSTNAVLKNTYRLLSMTLIFSALTACVGMRHPVGGMAMLGIFVVAIGLLFATRAFRDSGFGVALVFGFTGLMGYTLGPVLNKYLGMEGGEVTVGLAMLSTGAAFLGLSAYVHLSKKDFSYLGGFLFVGLIGLIVVSLIGLFFPVPGMSLVLAYFSAVLFSGYILYDTSRIMNGSETNYVMATISLYLDILNLFTSLLRIFSGSRG
jgi:modulator of FtsH protease